MVSRTGALEDDVLVNVEKIHSFFYKGIFQYITNLICLLSIIISGSCLVVLLTTYDIAFWQQYSPLILGGLTVVYSYIIFITGKKDFLHIHYGTLPKLKSYRDLDQKHFKVIKFQAKLAEFWVKSAITSIMLTVIVSLPFYGDEYDVMLPVKLCVDYLGKFAIVGQAFFFGHFLYGGFLIVGDAAALLYVVMHIKFQLFMLNTKLNNMETYHKLPHKDQQFRDEKFQKKVSKDLIDCVKHHQLIIELNKQFNKICRYPILGITLCSVVSLVAVVFAVYSDGAFPINPNGNIRILTISIFAFHLLGVFIYSGQTLFDECEQTFECIRNLSWYNYSTKNRMILLVFMQNIQIPLKLSSSGVVTIEYSLVIKIMRNVYSVFTFLSNIR